MKKTLLYLTLISSLFIIDCKDVTILNALEEFDSNTNESFDVSIFDGYYKDVNIEKKEVTELFKIDNEITSLQDGYSSLIVNKGAIANFEMSVDFYAPNDTKAFLVSKQSIYGENPLIDGLGAYVDASGNVNLKGMSDISGEYGTISKISGYNNTIYHNLKLKIYDIFAKLYVDNSLKIELKLPGFWEAACAGLGLGAEGKGVKFKNFKLICQM